MLAATLSLFAWCVIVVGTFASRFADRIQERNMFVVAPLFLILVLGWIERGAPRPRATAVVAGAASALLLLAIPFERFVTTSAVSDTLMLLPWWAILEHTGTSRLGVYALLGGVALAAVFVLVPTRYVLVLPAIVLVYWVVALRPIWFGPYPYGFKQAGAGSAVPGNPRRRRATGSTEPFRRARTWPSSGLEHSDRFTVNMNEFFNRRRRPGLLHGQSHARRDRGAGRQRRPGRRRPDGRRTSAPARVCARRRLARAERRPRRP